MPVHDLSHDGPLSMHAPTENKNSGGKRPRPRFSLWCLLRLVGRVIGALLLVLLLALGWLTSPWGEGTLTRLVQDTVNEAMQPQGLKLSIGGIGGLWRGQLRLWNVEMSDAKGPWLHSKWMRVVMRVPALLSGTVDIPLLEVEDTAFLRGPELPPATEEEPAPEPTEPAPIRALPLGWNVRLGDVRLNSFQVGEGDAALHIFARASGDVGHDAAALRVAVQSYRQAGVGFLPNLPGEVPEDITQPPRFDPPKETSAPAQAKGDAAPDDAAAVNDADDAQVAQHRPRPRKRPENPLKGTPSLVALLNVTWNDSYFDMRLQGRDALFLAESLSGLESVWTRTRVQANVAQWPPAPQQPAQVRFVSRFGVKASGLGEKVDASLLSGQAMWDGQTLVAQDIDLAVPQEKPTIELHGNAGYNATHGPGLRLQAALHDVARLARLAGMEQSGLAGSLQLRADMSRGGEHAAWWTQPLAQPASFDANPLAGFAVFLPQKKDTAPAGPVAGAVAGARASQAPTALHLDIGLDIPALTLPQGAIKDLKLAVQASSADADTAPQGTTSRKSDATQASAKGSQAAQGEASTTEVRKSAEDADFTTLGLPKAVVGRVELTVASLLDMGGAAFSTRWLAAGWPGEADVFQVQLDDTKLKFPGGSLDGDMGLAYALPVRRMWPWLDGTLHVKVDNWETISRLAATPIRGEGVGLDVGLESLYDPQGRARQYLKAQFKAAQVSTPSFAVKALGGEAVSQHVHALADAMSLSLNPQRLGSTSPEPTPTDDLSLLNANIRMGAGAGGPVTWKAGSCAVRVAGEQGTFEARLQGSLDAAVMGSYNFRQRLLKVQNLKLSYLVPAEKPQPGQAAHTGSVRTKEHTVGLHLTKEAVIALGDADAKEMRVSGVDIAFTPAGSLSLEARVPLGMQDPMQCTLQVQNLSLDVPHGLSYLAVPQQERGAALPQWLTAFPQGVITSSVKVGGTGASPQGDMRLQVAQIQSAAAPALPPLDIVVDGKVRPGGSYSTLDVRGEVKGLPEETAAPELNGMAMGGPRFSAKVPLRLSGDAAGLVETAPLEAQASWGGALAPLLQLYPLPGKKITGTAAVRVGVRGTAEKPQVNATALLRNGSFEDILNGVAVRDITLDGAYALQGPSKVQLSVGDGRGGTVKIDGTLRTPEGKEPEVVAQGKITRFRPLRRDDLSIQLSGELGVKGTLSSPFVQGNIVLDEGSFEILQGFGSSVRGLENVTFSDGTSSAAVMTAQMTAKEQEKAKQAATAKNKQQKQAKKTKSAKRDGNKAVNETVTKDGDGAVASLGPQLDMRISAPGKFFIRGQGLNSEWKTHLRITGPVSAPQIVGDVAPVRGTFDFLGKEFRFSGGKMSFDGGYPPNPALNLRMELRSGAVTAYIDVRGTGRSPKLDLASEPPLPRDEVMAQVLFGKSMNSLSRFETIQAATAAAQMTGMGPAGLASLNNVRDKLGLDALRMGRAGGSKGADVGRGMSSGLAGPAGSASDEEENSGQGSVLEAGKYVTDSIYVGLEQGLRPQDGTGVRVDMELTPSLSLSGRTSQQSSGVGLDWKYDY